MVYVAYFQLAVEDNFFFKPTNFFFEKTSKMIPNITILLIAF